MGKFKISETLVYRWRYQIGYLILGLLLIAGLIFAGMFIPGGISNAEIASAIKSSGTNLATLFSVDVVNLPYHLLQHASFSIFGVSNLSIKLPSIIIAFFSIVGLSLLLKQWFQSSIGLLASLIAVATGQFLFIAQNGTADIMFFFWPVWLILVASYIPLAERSRKVLVALFFGLAALSLYTPLSLYILIVISGSIILHPHLRFLLKQLTKLELALGFVVIALIISPLVLSIVRSPELAIHLLGWPAGNIDILANLRSLGVQYFGFMGTVSTAIITPFFELGSVLLILYGVYNVFRDRATAKSYVVILWTVCLIPVIILNPSFVSVTFLPLVLLLASGLHALLTYWYDLFPRNPYARITGLIPIVILVVVLISSGVNRYIYGYTYSPTIVDNFSKDLSLIPPNTKNIVTSNDELAFYNVVAKFNKNIHVSTTPDTDMFLATRDAKKVYTGYQIEKIYVSSNKDSSDRFYLYKKTAD